MITRGESPLDRPSPPPSLTGVLPPFHAVAVGLLFWVGGGSAPQPSRSLILQRSPSEGSGQAHSHPTKSWSQETMPRWEGTARASGGRLQPTIRVEVGPKTLPLLLQPPLPRGWGPRGRNSREVHSWMGPAGPEGGQGHCCLERGHSRLAREPRKSCCFLCWVRSERRCCSSWGGRGKDTGTAVTPPCRPLLSPPRGLGSRHSPVPSQRG